MSTGSYTTPPSSPGAAPTSGGGQIDVQRCLSEGWANTWANFPLWLGVGVVGTLVALLATATVIGVFLVLPALAWGAVFFLLRMHDGGAEFRDLFAGFSRYGNALASMLVCGLVLFVVGLAGQSIQLAGQWRGDTTIYAVGVVLNLAFTFFVIPRLYFAYFYIVDQDVAPIEAIHRSWERTAPVKWRIVAIMLATVVVGIVGLLALVVGVIPATTMIYLMWTSAYRQLTGDSPSG